MIYLWLSNRHSKLLNYQRVFFMYPLENSKSSSSNHLKICESENMIWAYGMIYVISLFAWKWGYIYIYMWLPCLQMADGPWTKIPWIWGILYQTDPFIYNYRRFQDQICGADVASMALEVTIYPAVCEQLVWPKKKELLQGFKHQKSSNIFKIQHHHTSSPSKCSRSKVNYKKTATSFTWLCLQNL